MLDRTATKRIAVAAVLFGLVALVCFNVLSGDRTFAFRDTGHFYRPLYQYIQSELDAGRLPLWNPLENLGGPLAGDPTAAVFYPPKLVFFLPGDFGCLMNLYLIGHLLLAAWATCRFARHVLRVGRTGATLAGISYALAGPVLAQTNNVIYLVGAAWLPLALELAYRTVGDEKLQQSLYATARNVVLLGLVLAMMILGGDPQMAYNVGLAAGLLVLIRLWQRRRDAKNDETDPQHPSPWRTAFRRSALLIAAATVAFLLSAIQVLPSASWSAKSDRTVDTTADRLLCRFEPGSHAARAYEFSVGPWRWPELLWPGVSGRQYPEHHRWLDTLPGERRIWTSSLYQSVLILLLALTTLSCRRRRKISADGKILRADPRVLWLQWLVLLGLIASLGRFGLGSLLSELHINPGVGSPFGGLYWLMTVVLPGYAKFRYPAKLLILVSFALAALAAVGWDRIERAAGERIERNRCPALARLVRRWTGMLEIVATISIFGMLVAWILRPYFLTIFATATPNILFGPLDATAANTAILLAMLQTTILCIIAARLLWRRRSTNHMGELRRAQLVIVAIVATDLLIAGRPLIVTAESEIWNRQSQIAAAIERLNPSDENVTGPPTRIYRSDYWLPSRWSHTAAPNRIEKHIAWDRETLHPKHQLADDLAMIGVHGSGRNRRFSEIAQPHWTIDRWRQLGVRAAIMPPSWQVPGWKQIPIEVEDTLLWIDPEKTQTVWIESADGEATRREKFGEARIVDWSPTKVEVEVSTDRPGRLVLADQYDEDWRATVDRQPAEIVPVDTALRGVAVDNKSRRVVFTYHPTAFYRGAMISLIAWSLLIATAAAIYIRSSIRRRTTEVTN